MDGTLVIGLGATGRSVIRHLDGRERVLAIDTRPVPPGLDSVREQHPTVPILAPADLPRALGTVARVVVSPGVRLDHCWVYAARSAGVALTSDVALMRAAAGDTPVLAVTGTNGKSTVATLVGELLAAQGLRVGTGANLGTPALDLLSENRDVYMLELSSFQLERLEQPGFAVAALLNVSADHADRHPDLDAYAACKRRIFGGAAKLIFNADDPRTVPTSADGADAAEAIALNGDARWRLTDDAVIVDGETLPVSALTLQGRHNHFNVLAAAAIARQAGVEIARHHATLTGFRGLPHRTEPVAVVDGVAYVNDSKATNVGACVAALAGLGDGQRNIVLIAGGDGKGASFADLAAPVRRHVSCAVLIGRDAPVLEQALGAHTRIARAGDMAGAVRAAHAAAAGRGLVLLSPACASFDRYAGFAARGEDFRAAVRRLAAERGC